MIKPLRKRHLQVWSLWAVLLPLTILGGALVRKEIPVDQSLDASFKNEQPVLLGEKIFGQFVVQLRTDQSSVGRQLVWINKQPLEVPTATIYQAKSDTNPISESKFIGRIEGVGKYYFDLSSPEKHFIVYDFIHQKIIVRIDFKW